MQATIEILWQRQRKGGDLGAVFTDHFVHSGAVTVDVGASFGLFSYHLARLVGRSSRTCSHLGLRQLDDWSPDRSLAVMGLIAIRHREHRVPPCRIAKPDNNRFQ